MILALEWLPMDSWIVIVGALSSLSCALLGNFLVLRKMSMMGDAISHAVLPGLAGAFLLTIALQSFVRGSPGSLPGWIESIVLVNPRSSFIMFIGAVIAGIATAAFTQWVHAAGKVDQNASMGVVFTVLFALGLIMIRFAADAVDLDPDCVLNGAIELTPLDTVLVAGFDVPRAAISSAIVFFINAAIVAVLYKELKITSFDPALATTLGINAGIMHYLLMVLVAITTVAAFESVGSILVIAMLIVPPAAAHLLSDRLGVMIIWSLVIAVLSALGGHVAAITAPAWFGFAGQSTNTSGMMGVVAGLLFIVTMLVAPRHGLISKLVRKWSLSLQIVREDLLGLLYRLDERGQATTQAAVPALLRKSAGAGALLTRIAIGTLKSRGMVSRQNDKLQLTPAGREAGGSLIRSHRLWETYLEQNIAAPTDHLHDSAEVLEHVTDAELRRRLSADTGDPTHDPQGLRIPPG